MKYLWTVLIFLSLVMIGYTFISSGGENKEEYTASVLKQREEKERFMKNDPESPFRKKGEVNFDGLKYYDPDPAFRIKARIIPIKNPEVVMLTLSDGSQRKYFRYAWAEFELSGTQQKLALLKSEDYWDEGWLFLPFYDETSADETYGGGRFLEIDYTGGSEATIDFNECYNPYCAYTDTYRCPFPPPENHVTVKVTAGEKIYRDDH